MFLPNLCFIWSEFVFPVHLDYFKDCTYYVWQSLVLTVKNLGMFWTSEKKRLWILRLLSHWWVFLWPWAPLCQLIRVYTVKVLSWLKGISAQSTHWFPKWVSLGTESSSQCSLPEGTVVGSLHLGWTWALNGDFFYLLHWLCFQLAFYSAFCP